MNELSHDIAISAEEDVISVIMVDDRFYQEVRNQISADDFFDPVCRTVFEEAEMMYMNGAREINGTEILKAVIDRGFRGDEVTDRISIALRNRNAKAPAAFRLSKTVRIESEKRRAWSVFRDSLGEIVRPNVNPMEVVSNAIEKLESDRSEIETSVSQPKAVDEYIAEIEEPEKRFAYASFGIPEIDEEIDMRGLVVVAARPSVGKTVFGLQAADHNARKGRTVLVVSLEMKRTELVDRFARRETGIETHPRDLTAQEKIALGKAASELPETIHYVDSSVNVSQIKRFAKLLQMRSGLDLIVVDRVGLLRPEEKFNGPTEKMLLNSQALQQLSHSLSVPVLALCQLNRASESQDKPTMANLAWSSGVEEMSHAVMLMWRDVDDNGNKFIGLDVPKNRNGRVFETKLIEGYYSLDSRRHAFGK